MSEQDREEWIRQIRERLEREEAAKQGGKPNGADTRRHAELPPDAAPIPFSHEWLAKEFSRRHAGDLRYLAVFGQWFLWRGTHWRTEKTLKAFDLARATCRAAAANVDKSKEAAAISSAPTVAAVERLARSDRTHATEPDDWNQQHDSLNMPTKRGI